ncbi:MAG: contractile injection system protein, VgrG/Pvc8 family, partial [Pseudomonadota bacterium]
MALSISLTIQTETPATFVGSALRGSEAISSLYEITVRFYASSTLTDSDVVGESAEVVLTSGAAKVVHEMLVYGVITRLELVSSTNSSTLYYEATIKPVMSALENVRQSQVYGPDSAVTISDLITDVMDASKRSASTTKDDGAQLTTALPWTDSLTASLSYPRRDFVLQYEETDYNFLARHCEDVGVFFYFKHVAPASGNGSEEVVFGDDNDHFDVATSNGETYSDAAANKLTLTYSNSYTPGAPEALQLYDFTFSSERTPGKVYLRDYNPSGSTTTDSRATTMFPSASVTSADTVGVHVEYGSHFTSGGSSDDGGLYAGVRAEEKTCWARLYTGKSNVPYLRPGYSFVLSGFN